jgi:imidazolonepropionase-like amidohydrolase
MVLKNPVGLKIALGENPSTYGIDSKCSVTRMATTALIRELFMKCQNYIVQKAQGKLKERDIKLEAVIPVLKGDISLRAHAQRADDIVTVIRIAEEFNIKKLVIEHGTEANLIKDYIKEKKVPIAFGPMLTPRIKKELKRRRYGSALELFEAGVKVALITDHPYNPIDQLRTIAILSVSEGLKPIDDLRAITIHPAEILECDNRIGGIKKRNDADIIVFNGHPLDINSKVIITIINGEVIYIKN